MPTCAWLAAGAPARPSPSPSSRLPLEQALAASAEPGSVELLDTALRTLNHHAQQEGRTLPAILGARITHRTLDLLLDTDAESQAAPDPVQPFKQHKHDPNCWTWDRSHQLLDHDQARTIPAPYPGLTTIGTDPDGNHLLANLPAARVLLLDGDPDAVRDAARSAAVTARGFSSRALAPCAAAARPLTVRRDNPRYPRPS
ncbi:hypothetical protein [Streptomyces sp. NPDC056453]|uniref:hypothetical protein n=1 Tax=Streptomyces sp. NPDC056453 TaxID=3345822 RepID=UPI00369C5604